jgi:hypothetical protein
MSRSMRSWLSNFEFDTVGGKPMLFERAAERAHKVPGEELLWREIDRDHKVRRPLCGVPAGFVDGPLSDGGNGAGLLGDGDEFRGCDGAKFRIVEPDQRLEATEFAGPRLVDRLEDEPQCIVGHGLRHGPLQRETAL